MPNLMIDPEATLPAMIALVDDIGRFAGVMLCALGARLGLNEALAAGPTTADDLADRAGVDRRVTLEWLRGLAAAGYVEHGGGSYRLSDASTPMWTDAGGPFSLGGLFEGIGTIAAMFEEIVDAARTGCGIPQADYPPSMTGVLARMSATIYDYLLVDWIRLVPGLVEALESTGSVAEIGCGEGRALIALARAFPGTTCVGFDQFAPALDRAAAAAEGAGLADRVSFRQTDVATGIPGSHDLLLAFDVLHDCAHPHRMLTSARAAIAPTGSLLIIEPASADDPAGNVGPVASIDYLMSMSYCLQVSLAAGGPGLGTCGLPESALRSQCLDAGFSSVSRIDTMHPVYALYEVKP